MRRFSFTKTIFFSLMVILYSCSTEELENKISDLEQEGAEANAEIRDKEAAINEFIGALNVIQENLNQIKEREHALTTRFDNGDAQFDENIEGQIINDIEVIDRLLLENKDRMNALRVDIKKSNLRVSELEVMIERIANQLQVKDAEIANLQEQLAEANNQLKVLFQEYNNRIKELGEQEDKLNKAYYCYGTSKELKEQGVITKEGGFVGIGRTERLSTDFNRDYFTQIDTKLVTEVEMVAKKIRVITNHPSDSYMIEGDEELPKKVIILDSEAFWSTSKYLVVLVD